MNKDLVVPMIMNPDEVKQSNYPYIQSVYIDIPINELQMQNQLKISLNDYIYETSQSVKLNKQSTKIRDVLQQDLTKYRKVISVNAIRSLIIQHLQGLKRKQPSNLRADCLIHLIKDLNIKPSFYTQITILSLIPQTNNADYAIKQLSDLLKTEDSYIQILQK